MAEPIESGRPRLTSAPFDDPCGRYLSMFRFKAEPCPIDGCHQDPAKCPFLHPGEKGRRDPRRYSYCSDPCWYYSVYGGSCPLGDDCGFAHGFLEHRFHPLMYMRMKGGVFSDLEAYAAYLKVKERLDPHLADAGERAAVEFILDLKSNGRIHEYEPYGIQLFDAPSFYNETSTGQSFTSFLHDTLFKRYPGAIIVTGGTYGCGNSLTSKKNGWPIIVPDNDGSPDPQQHLLGNPFYESYKASMSVPGTFAHLIPKDIKDAVGATLTNERMRIDLGTKGVLAVFGHSAKTPVASNNLGGASRSGRRLLADTGASMHAVGDYRFLRGVELFTSPMCATLPDGTELRIVGIGRIEWEHFSVPNVYLVDGFQKSLISISQLDRDHGMRAYFGNGNCEIMQADGITRAGGGMLEDDGMYVLHFLNVPKPAQE
uniref:C3H1-type domain-containing protein n=1 Tax=Arundo donax TaxID=35708 RepID=A0A0A9E127_ARUDO